LFLGTDKILVGGAALNAVSNEHLHWHFSLAFCDEMAESDVQDLMDFTSTKGINDLEEAVEALNQPLELSGWKTHWQASSSDSCHAILGRHRTYAACFNPRLTHT
jgi:hypothetical protein